MEWQDEGIILTTRVHGENAAIVTILTRFRGRCAGMARTSKKNSASILPGSRGRMTWKARLPEHLGTWAIEQTQSAYGALLMTPRSQEAFMGLSSACTLTNLVLPEREEHPDIYNALHHLIDQLATPQRWTAYIAYELMLLKEVGFGLDLSRCAATGSSENLMYVSPKTGRAVSQEAGRAYHDRLLPLPRFSRAEEAEASPQDLLDGFKLTGFFLESFLNSHHDKALPPIRKTLQELFVRKAA